MALDFPHKILHEFRSFLGDKAFPTAPDVVDHALHMHYEAHLQ